MVRMKKRMLVILSILIFGIGAFSVRRFTNPRADGTPEKVLPSYTMQDVAAHNTANNCWAAINDQVYDLMEWVDFHPGGGGNIINICGKDGSEAFNKQHGSKEEVHKKLDTFLKGNLTE